MQLTIYADENCFLRRKIEAAAVIAGCTFERKDPKEYDVSQCQWTRYPAVMTPHGIVFGSDAALRYIAQTHTWTELYGKDLASHTRVDTMLSVFASEFETPLFAVSSVKKETVAEDLLHSAAKANNCLEKASFVAGERLTIADITLAAALVGAIHNEKVIAAEDLAKFPHLVRLINTVSARANWGITLKADANAAQTPAAEAPKKKEQPKKEQPKKQEAPKAEPAPAPVKEKDPIELLPPNDFDMDAWKRCYSNTKDLKGVAMPYLWEHIEKAGADGWSFWTFEYIRFNNEDNTKVFMASNLLGMFLQRIDNWLRKYMFGVCNVFEEDGYFGVKGLMMWRGQEVPKRLFEHDQFESFTWTKLNYPQDKQIITDYFCEGDEIQGKKIADCKVYK